MRRDDVQRFPRPKVPDATRVVLPGGGQVVPVWREVDPQNLQATLAALLNDYRPSIQPSRQPALEIFHRVHMLVSSSSYASATMFCECAKHFWIIAWFGPVQKQKTVQRGPKLSGCRLIDVSGSLSTVDKRGPVESTFEMVAEGPKTSG